MSAVERQGEVSIAADRARQALADAARSVDRLESAALPEEGEDPSERREAVDAERNALDDDLVRATAACYAVVAAREPEQRELADALGRGSIELALAHGEGRINVRAESEGWVVLRHYPSGSVRRFTGRVLRYVIGDAILELSQSERLAGEYERRAFERIAG